jgi:hypothetical protein
LATGAILVACSTADSGDQSGGQSPPGATAVNSNAAPSSGNNQTASPPAANCGVYHNKPSRQQWLNDLRAAAAAEWDASPVDQQSATREQFSEARSSIGTAPVYGPLSDADILDAAPGDGPEQFGKLYCKAEWSSFPVDVSGTPATTLFVGLSICTQLAGNKLPPALDAKELAFHQSVKKFLCPQIPYVMH